MTTPNDAHSTLPELTEKRELLLAELATVDLKVSALVNDNPAVVDICSVIDLRHTVSDDTVIGFVQNLLKYADAKRATAIHVSETVRDGLTVLLKHPDDDDDVPLVWRYHISADNLPRCGVMFRFKILAGIIHDYIGEGSGRFASRIKGKFCDYSVNSITHSISPPKQYLVMRILPRHNNSALADAIHDALYNAGGPIHIDALAKIIDRPAANIRVWASTTGKNTHWFSKVARATYSYNKH